MKKIVFPLIMIEIKLKIIVKSIPTMINKMAKFTTKLTLISTFIIVTSTSLIENLLSSIGILIVEILIIKIPFMRTFTRKFLRKIRC